MKVNKGTGKGLVEQVCSVIEWGLEASFLALWYSRSKSLKGSSVWLLYVVPPTSQKDGVEGNGGSFKDGAEAFMLLLLNWFWGLQGLQGSQGWPTARDSGWWQLAGETKSPSVENWN
jgi:hypothetical protein